MDKKIAVERTLTPVKNYLSERGYQVDSIDVECEYGDKLRQYDALVVTGMSKDILGIQDIVSDIPVIDAKGLTAEEVYDQLSSKLE